MTNVMCETTAQTLSNNGVARDAGVKRVAAAALVAVVLCGPSVRVQQAPSSAITTQASPLTLRDAVQLALATYPAVQEQRARAKAAEEGIAVARTAYLPRFEALLQENRATHNNVLGILFPQGVVPPVSGPVLPKAPESVWGRVITQRDVHVGTLVGPSSTSMLRIQQISRLRLVVDVPETAVGGVERGELVAFTVPAYPDETFNGRVARLGHALDPKTRTMPVELDVSNTTGRLAPGMFAQVSWSMRRARPSLFVPASAIATTTERTFVVRVRENKAEWVDIKRGASMDQLVEVFGTLKDGDQVALRGTDEIRQGSRVSPKAAAPATP